ncbi:uncharacterized protein CDV56_109650 [Aspergillus thermomutatus]|uniref:DUF6546 domain-containing protein n=1 Tax=Aspergillus thermomutatus TaxID=41047 RepID=A0A397I166_ASPTH|nr:uncharacterized protein CDV56_109650 [Aspergillus thermomutatus]RHZ67978.1 hypothetical protein CDV56_109650 [Aspergillus thermomutatus]
MDALPTELLTIVLHHLYDENQAPNAVKDLPDGWESGSLATYTVVSRRWQAILEPMIWKQIVILKPDALERLEEYTSDKPHRIARIKWVRRILWEPYVNFALAERLREGMKDYPKALACVLPYQYPSLYRQAFAGIFRILGRWESECDDSMVELFLTVEHLECPPKLSLSEWNWDVEDATVEELWRMDLIVHLVHLTTQDASAYPILRNVRSLSLEPCMTNMRPSAFFQLLSRLPNVRHVSAGESVFILPFALRALRAERRLPLSVEEFEYEIAPEREMSWTPVQDAANYLSVRGLDKLSIAFRTLSMRLRVLRLNNVRVNSELFWASPEEDSVISDTLHWPVLEVIEITDTPPYTADGKWILDNDPDKKAFMEMEDFDSGWDYEEMGFNTRGLIRSDEVDKLYSAMGKAARRMPRLRYLEFRFRGETPTQEDWECLIFFQHSETGEAGLAICTEWKYNLGEEVIAAWGLEGEKAKEFRTYWTIQLDHWPSVETGIRRKEI